MKYIKCSDHPLYREYVSIHSEPECILLNKEDCVKWWTENRERFERNLGAYNDMIAEIWDIEYNENEKGKVVYSANLFNGYYRDLPSAPEPLKHVYNQEWQSWYDNFCDFVRCREHKQQQPFVVEDTKPCPHYEHNFISLCVAGIESIDNIDEYINRWHNSRKTMDLHTFLGMTWYEYYLWVCNSSIVQKILQARKDNVPITSLLTEEEMYPNRD